jgi:iron-sulfur cluster assembly accessory protein
MANFTATDLAVTKLQDYMAQNSIQSALRVALMQGGCSGPSLGLALDEPKTSDQVFENNSLQFLVDTELLSACGAITVDFIDAGMRSGFLVSSTNPIGGGCSTGSCSSGGCSGCGGD